MGLLANQEIFKSAQDEYRQVTVVAAAGTATLQSLARTAAGVIVPVDVPDGASAADTSYTMHCPRNAEFWFVLTGAATVSVSG